MTNKKFIEVEIIRAGQPRPYADETYEGYLTFRVPEGQLWSSRFPIDKESVKPYVKLLIHPFVDEPEWHQPRLKELNLVNDERGNIKWHAIVTSPYLD